MKHFALAALALILSVSPARADSITLNAFNNSTPATVTFNDGQGHSGSIDTFLTQLNVTYAAGAGTPVTFKTFTIDLFHSASVGQTYLVTPRGDLATAFANGGRMAYIFQTFGLGDLANSPIQAAAVQIALWDLSLGNHNPTLFGLDADGSYSSGDETVFRVLLSGGLASQMAALTDQYLAASVGATALGAWLDADAAGDAPNRGQSLLLPVPAPPSGLLAIAGAACWALRPRGGRARWKRRR